MELSDRKKKILAAVVDSYIDLAEPVGSKAITAKYGLNFSSATIRNEMAELELLGLLEQPHTSAGRIPTPRGYRLYVDELMRRHSLSARETEELNLGLRIKMQQLDRLITDVGRLAAQLTDLAVLSLAAPAKAVITRFDLIYIDANNFIIVSMLSNNTVKNKLIRLPFSIEEAFIKKLSAVVSAHFTNITEDKITSLLIESTERALGDTMGLTSIIAGFAIEILSAVSISQSYVTGAANLLRQPEYKNRYKAHRMLDYLSDSRNLLDYFSDPRNLLESPATDGESAVRVIIGPENIAEELKESSVVMVKYDLGDDAHGLLGVVGPTRMDYGKVAAGLDYIAVRLSRLLHSGESPPEGWGKLKPID